MGGDEFIMNKIYDLLSNYDENKEEVTLSVLEKFEPLLNKYSRKTYYSDMKNDLVLFFLELIPKIPIHKDNFKQDKYIISYINKSIRNQYILLNKKYHNNLNNELSLEYKNYMLPVFNQSYENIELQSIIEKLTVKEKQVIIYRYKCNLSFADIAKITHKSRQCVYKTHKRAINKLRNFLIII